MRATLFEQQLREARRPLTISELDRLGVSRKARDGPKWHRTSRGSCTRAGREESSAQRILDEVAALPEGSTLGGWAAAFVHGVDWQFRQALAHTDAGVRSPWESRLRLVAVLEAGLPRLLVKPAVYDDRGSFVAIPDLLDVEAGLVLEYDGSGHCERRQHNADNASLTDEDKEALWGDSGRASTAFGGSETCTGSP